MMDFILRGMDLKKYFGRVRAVDGVTLSLVESEILGIVGPNGAGKTTLLNILSGILKPDGGKVLLRVEKEPSKFIDVTGWPPQRLAMLGVARAFQIPNVFDNLTVLDNVRTAIIGRKRLHRRPFKPYEGGLPDVDSEAEDILEFVGLKGQSYKRARDLSHGGRKLLDIALSLSLHPRILMLDEPTAGLSFSEKEAISRLIARLRSERRISIIIVEHDLDVIFRVSDRVIVMHEGRILAEGPPDSIREDERVRKVYLGGG